jgi:hypothetical protein
MILADRLKLDQGLMSPKRTANSVTRRSPDLYGAPAALVAATFSTDPGPNMSKLSRGSAALLTSVAMLGVSAAGADAAVVFDGTPGTDAPPATLGGYAVTPFGDDASPLFSDVTSIPTPTGGSLSFAQPVNHRRIGSGWASWSHGYTGDVYYNGSTSATLTVPASTKAFRFYVEPNPFDTFRISATAQDGTTSGPVDVSGASGAKYYGFYGTGGDSLASITISGDVDFAVGEFGISAAPAAPSVASGSGVSHLLTSFNFSVSGTKASPAGSAEFTDRNGVVRAGDVTCLNKVGNRIVFGIKDTSGRSVRYREFYAQDNGGSGDRLAELSGSQTFTTPPRQGCRTTLTSSIKGDAITSGDILVP